MLPTATTAPSVRRPRDGRAFQALLVGGHDELFRKLQEFALAEFGIATAHHWATGTSILTLRARRIPAGCELVIVISEAIKTMAKECIDKAREAGALLAIVGPRKAEWAGGLGTAGFTRNPEWRRAAPPPSAAAPPKIVPIRPSDPPAPIAPAAPAEAPKATAPAFDPAARYVRPAGKKWTDEEMGILCRVAEAAGDDAQAFANAFAAAAGGYRFPGGLHLRLRPLAAVVKIPPGLIRNLERAAHDGTKAKAEFIRSEAAAFKARGASAIGEWMSSALAEKLVGGVASRLAPCEMRQDKQSSCYVFRTAEVMARAAELEARNGGPLSAAPMGPAPRFSDAEIEARILARAAESPGIGAKAMGKGIGTDEPRFGAILRRMADHGKIVVAPAPGGHGRIVGPPGWAPPPKSAPKPPAPPKPRADATPPLAAPATSLTAEIYRAIRAKEITPEEGARMLRELRGS